MLTNPNGRKSQSVLSPASDSLNFELQLLEERHNGRQTRERLKPVQPFMNRQKTPGHNLCMNTTSQTAEQRDTWKLYKGQPKKRRAL
jgi:hypothetical protein